MEGREREREKERERERRREGEKGVKGEGRIERIGGREKREEGKERQ